MNDNPVSESAIMGSNNFCSMQEPSQEGEPPVKMDLPDEKSSLEV